MPNEEIHCFGSGAILFFALQAFAQEHYTEGPIWQVTLIRVKPTQMDAYLTSSAGQYQNDLRRNEERRS